MPTYKEFNSKLVRLRNTRKMTRTMKMIAVTRMRRAQNLRQRADVYAANLDRIIARMARLGGATLSQGLVRPAPAGAARIRVILISSDRGLCGGFNAGLFRFLLHWMDARHATPDRCSLTCLGRRGALYFRNRDWPLQVDEMNTSQPEYSAVQRVGMAFQSDFLADRCDAVYIAYNRLSGTMRNEPCVCQLLPFENDVPALSATDNVDECIVEPGPREILAEILPQVINFRLYLALLTSAAGEHAARMMAMDGASRNADEMIDQTTMLRNRARQSAITRELMEIIAGAEEL